jgi:hypothetical protein
VQEQGGPDHVHHRVHGPDLVEVDLVDGLAVDPGLGLGQAAEDGQRAVPHRPRQVGLAEGAAQVGPGADDMGALGPDPDQGGPDPAPLDPAHLQLERVNGQPLEPGPQRLGRPAGVQQRPQHHVPGRPGEAVEVGEGHGA